MKNNRCIIILFILVSVGMSAQPSISGNKVTYKRQYQHARQVFKDSTNAQFSRYLQNRWEALQLFQATPYPSRPDGPQQPELDTPNDTSSDPLPFQQISKLTPHAFEPTIIGSMAEMDNQAYGLSFYGINTSIYLPRDISTLRLYGIRETDVATLWDSYASMNLTAPLAFITQQKRTLQLNGWGIFDYIQQLSAKVYPKNTNQQTVFTVFLANKLGYDIRIGRCDNQLVVLLASDIQLYGVPYTQINHNKYYAFPNWGITPMLSGSIYTYKKQSPGAVHKVDMLLTSQPQLGGKLSTPSFRSTFDGHSIVVSVRQSLIDFYARYPQMELSAYANAPVDEVFRMSIERNLKPLIHPDDPYRSVSNLLRFVQETFRYQSDAKTHGYEKNNFCEENFYYPANDCEDRAILFSYLIKTLVGLDVVLVDYSDHVAAAVNFPRSLNVDGDYYRYNDSHYVFCDPTCKNAKVGQISSKYKTRKPQIINIV